MKLYLSAILFALVALSTSCKSKETVAETATEDRATEETPTMQKEAHQLIIDKSFAPQEGMGDPINIVKSEIQGDILKLTVTYSGGCKDHTFELKANGAIMKSMPPQMPIMLIHEGNGDDCRSLIEETLKFDVSPARMGGDGEIILILNGDRENRVSYKYQ